MSLSWRCGTCGARENLSPDYEHASLKDITLFITRVHRCGGWKLWARRFSFPGLLTLTVIAGLVTRAAYSSNGPWSYALSFLGGVMLSPLVYMADCHAQRWIAHRP